MNKVVNQIEMKQEDRITKQKRLIRGILAIYILLMIRLVVFKYPFAQLQQIAASWDKSVILEGLDSANFTPFKTIRMYIEYYERLNSFENLFGNIFIFVPFGFLLPYAFERFRNGGLVLIVTFVLVSCIELFQLFSAFGAFDVDDFMLNCFGSLLGYWMASWSRAIGRYRRKGSYKK